MTNLALDRSTSIQKLRDADCPPPLAEAIVDVVSISVSEIATKGDFESMKKDVLRLEDAIKEQKEDIKEQRKEITQLDGKVNKLSYEFQGLQKEFRYVDKKAEFRWKIQQAQSEALNAKIDEKFEKFEAIFLGFKSTVLLSVVGGILLAAAIIKALAYFGIV